MQGATGRRRKKSDTSKHILAFGVWRLEVNFATFLSSIAFLSHVPNFKKKKRNKKSRKSRAGKKAQFCFMSSDGFFSCFRKKKCIFVFLNSPCCLVTKRPKTRLIKQRGNQRSYDQEGGKEDKHEQLAALCLR
jgi:hypothetical protein